MGKVKIVSELIAFLIARKLWWIVPMLIIFLMVGVLIIFVGSSPLAPIVYPLF